MPSQTHSTLDSGHSTPPSDDEVLVRVEGVSKKFCRSLKKSLCYGVCDIASELNPFGRTAAFVNPHKNLTTIEHGGRCEKEQPKVGPKGERVGTSESKDTEKHGGKQGCELETLFSGVFGRPLASGLADGLRKTRFHSLRE